MLVLTRKPGERLVISGGVTVTVVAVVGNQVRIGIEAPDDVTVYREEIVPAHAEHPAPANAGVR